MNGRADGKVHGDWSPVAHGKLHQAIAADWRKVAELTVDVNITHAVALWRERGENILKKVVSNIYANITCVILTSSKATETLATKFDWEVK